MRPRADLASFVAALAALGARASCPLLAGPFYGSSSSPRSMILAIFALSLELLVGTTGLVSFGHAAFFGVGAYAPALLRRRSTGAASSG